MSETLGESYYDAQQGTEFTWPANLVSSSPQDLAPSIPQGVYKKPSRSVSNLLKPEDKPKELVYEQEGSLVIESKKLKILKPYRAIIDNVEFTVIKTKDGKIEIHEFTPN